MEDNKKESRGKQKHKAPKAKRIPENDIEEIIKEPSKLSNQFENLEVEDSGSDYLIEGESEDDQEVMSDVSDKSEEYIEATSIEKNQKTDKKKVNIFDEKQGNLKEDEALDYDNEAYEMMHRATAEWPCLTIDFILPEKFYPPVSGWFKDYKPVSSLDQYPYSTYMAAGSQTDTANGFLYVMKWSNMMKTKYDDDPDFAPDSDSDDGQDPTMIFEKVKVKGSINRLKTLKNSYLCAYWTDSAAVEIVDLRPLINDLDDRDQTKKDNKGKRKKIDEKNIKIKSFAKKKEGFGIDWNPFTPGVLAVGGYEKNLDIYHPHDENCSSWNDTPLISLSGHTKSIEDVCFSPAQEYVVSTCSVDSTVRFWDLRSKTSGSELVIKNAHESDVNVISWNSICNFLVASGGDDKAFKIWDIRYINHGPISNIRWHKEKITAISWDPFDDSQVAVASEDHRVSVWDFSVEPDDKHLFDSKNDEIPQQLVFLHQGQNYVKDLKFHPVYKNMITTTAENGINIFRPAFDDDSDSEDDENDQNNIDID
jgi:ribosome assembly protein RRB1